MSTNTALQAPYQHAQSVTTTYTTTNIPNPDTTNVPYDYDSSTLAMVTSTTNPYPLSSDLISQPQCPSTIRYQFAVAILGTGIAIAAIVLAIIFLYLKPKKWQKKGAASRDAEMEALKKENEEFKSELRGAGAYARLGTMPPGYVAMGPRGLW